MWTTFNDVTVIWRGNIYAVNLRSHPVLVKIMLVYLYVNYINKLCLN